MPLNISDDVRVTLPLGGGDQAVFIFPPYDDAEMRRQVRVLLDNRYKQRGGRGKVQNKATEARRTFFDKMCTGCEGVEYNGKPIQEALPDAWKSKIPDNIVSSIVSVEFEERETLSDEDREDLADASDDLES